jgi:hypothetical protein
VWSVGKDPEDEEGDGERRIDDPEGDTVDFDFGEGATGRRARITTHRKAAFVLHRCFLLLPD